MTTLSPRLQRYFTPLQYGIGVRAGAEIMTHTIKAHLQLNPSHLVIQTDLANAFNSWSRDKLYPIVNQHFPELSHVIRAAYGNPSQVLFAEPNQSTHSIQSTVGSRQGCVAGSLAFCLAFQPILQTIAHEYPDSLILSYCDDMYVIGTPERAAHAYRRYAFLISQHLQAQLRDDKAHAYPPAASQEDISKVLGRVPLKHARHTSSRSASHANSTTSKEYPPPVTRAPTSPTSHEASTSRSVILSELLFHIPTFQATRSKSPPCHSDRQVSVTRHCSTQPTQPSLPATPTQLQPSANSIPTFTQPS